MQVRIAAYCARNWSTPAFVHHTVQGGRIMAFSQPLVFYLREVKRWRGFEIQKPNTDLNSTPLALIATCSGLPVRSTNSPIRCLARLRSFGRHGDVGGSARVLTAQQRDWRHLAAACCL